VRRYSRIPLVVARRGLMLLGTARSSSQHVLDCSLPSRSFLRTHLPAIFDPRWDHRVGRLRKVLPLAGEVPWASSGIRHSAVARV
jgi:hypothetical protein